MLFGIEVERMAMVDADSVGKAVLGDDLLGGVGDDRISLTRADPSRAGTGSDHRQQAGSGAEIEHMARHWRSAFDRFRIGSVALMIGDHRQMIFWYAIGQDGALDLVDQRVVRIGPADRPDQLQRVFDPTRLGKVERDLEQLCRIGGEALEQNIGTPPALVRFPCHLAPMLVREAP